MAWGDRPIMRDTGLRTAGLVLLLVGALALRHLFQLACPPPRVHFSLLALGWGLLGFCTMSGGAGLLLAGGALLQPVSIARRWRCHDPVRSAPRGSQAGPKPHR